MEEANAATEGLEVVQGNGLAVAVAAFKAAQYDLKMQRWLGRKLAGERAFSREGQEAGGHVPA